MRLVNNYQDNAGDVDGSALNIALESLRRHKENPTGTVSSLPRDLAVHAGQLVDVRFIHLRDCRRESVYLLVHKWLRRRDEENLAGWEPPIIVEHYCGGDERLAESSR